MSGRSSFDFFYLDCRFFLNAALLEPQKPMILIRDEVSLDIWIQRIVYKSRR